MERRTFNKLAGASLLSPSILSTISTDQESEIFIPIIREIFTIIKYKPTDSNNYFSLPLNKQDRVYCIENHGDLPKRYIYEGISTKDYIDIPLYDIKKDIGLDAFTCLLSSVMDKNIIWEMNTQINIYNTIEENQSTHIICSTNMADKILQDLKINTDIHKYCQHLWKYELKGHFPKGGEILIGLNLNKDKDKYIIVYPNKKRHGICVMSSDIFIGISKMTVER